MQAAMLFNSGKTPLPGKMINAQHFILVAGLGRILQVWAASCNVRTPKFHIPEPTSVQFLYSQLAIQALNMMNPGRTGQH